MTQDVLITNGTIVSPDLGTFEADLGIQGERISAIAARGELDGEQEIDATDRYVLPGAIDPHTHHGVMRDLATDAASESRSGLVGGVTTVGIIYRSGDPYTEIIQGLFERCEPHYYHDYFFTLAPFSTTHLTEIPALIEDHGITSFKWYQRFKHRAAELFDVDRDLQDDYADDLIQILAQQPTATTLGCHSENAEITLARKAEIEKTDTNRYEALIEAFPDYAETQGMVAGASLARAHDYDDSLYAVHISAGRTADALASLKEIGYGVIGETCPHYLTFTTDECDKRMAARPPIRSAADRETLWNRVADGTIQCIGTDHCMKPYDRKIGADYWETETAFPGTATMLPLLLSQGVIEGRISLERLVEITSTNPAKAWGLYPKKGSLRVGTDADITIVDLSRTETVTPDRCKSAATYTPYDGMELTGWPVQTIVRGELAYDDGVIVGEQGAGTHVDRPV